MTFIPAGKYFSRSFSLARMRSAVSRALAPGSWRTARTPAGFPLYRALRSARSVPSSARPTSLTLTTDPSGLVRSGIDSNSWGVTSSDWTRMGALRRWPGTAGAPPSWPAETSTL